jgi:hypothetical protein
VPDDEQKSDDTKPTEADAPETSDAGAAHEGKFSPEDIAARVARIGEETELDRVADEEEKKLLERKKSQKKRGLEAAASKRLAKIGEGAVKRPTAALGALSPDADPLLERAARANKWIQEHRQTFGAIAAVALLGLAGFGGWSYWQDKRNGQASALLAQALADQHGYVSDKATDEDEEDKPAHLYPTFKTAAERRDAALEKYRAVESKFAGTGAAMLAQLAEGSLLLDAGDAKGAIAAYQAVKDSPLGQADNEVRGRAFEGIGFADELLAQTDAGNKDKHLADALDEFEKLEHVDVDGFKELGLYHQARVQEAKGDKAKAIELLKDVQKRVSDPGQTHPFSYLEFVVEDRLRELDPTALPPKAPKSMGMGAPGKGPMGPGGGPGGLDMNDPQIRKLIEQLKQKKGVGAPPGLPPMPPNGAPPAPAPEESPK